MKRVELLPGQKFNRLTIIKYIPGYRTDPKSGKNHGKWAARCDCGNTVYTDAGKLIRGYTKSCGCLARELLIARNKNMPHRKYAPIETSAREVWRHSYKDCDFELFLRLSQLPCHYCGSPPHRTFNKKRKDRSDNQIVNGNFTYNGLDRLDNNFGHCDGNVVPCCWDCNHMKGTRTAEQFINHIFQICRNQTK